MEQQTSLSTKYKRDGFLIATDLLKPHECEQLKVEGLKVLQEHAKPGSTVFVGAAAASPMYYQLASDPRIVSILRHIMPDGIMFMSDKLVFKSGILPTPTPWHCDIAYWKNTRTKLSVWIALDNVTAENGALKVLPGGHLQEWQHDQPEQTPGVEFNNRIQDLNGQDSHTITCEMSAGSALFFSDRLPHSSHPNSNGADRYSIISTYHAPAPDEEFDLSFPARHVIEDKQ